MSKPTIDRDAEEFGVHVKAEGWRLGLLVARNVEKGEAGRPPRNRNVRNDFQKVSASEFAKKADTSTPRVLRYLVAWEAAAVDGLVPPAGKLSPGEELDLDVDKLGDWSEYYPPAQTDYSAAPPERRKAYEAAADEEGTTAAQVFRAAGSAPAIAAAIKADPKIAEAALRAIEQRNARPVGQPSSPVDRSNKPIELVAHFRDLHKTVERLVRLVLDGRAVVSDDEAAALLDEVRWLRNALDYIESGLNAGSLDKALAELLEADR